MREGDNHGEPKILRVRGDNHDELKCLWVRGDNHGKKNFPECMRQTLYGWAVTIMVNKWFGWKVAIYCKVHCTTHCRKKKIIFLKMWCSFRVQCLTLQYIYALQLKITQ